MRERADAGGVGSSRLAMAGRQRLPPVFVGGQVTGARLAGACVTQEGRGTSLEASLKPRAFHLSGPVDRLEECGEFVKSSRQ